MDARRIRIRRVEPAAEKDRIVAVLARNLPAASAPERIDWLYASNPDGPSLVWLAEDEQGRAVGTSAAHPRRMRLGGEIVRALNLSDFAFDASFRSLGPALSLLRATLQPVREGEYAFSYDYPSRSMHAIYRRMGGIDLGPTERWVRPATLKGVAERKLGGLVGGVVGAVGDAALRTRDALARGARELEVDPHTGGFGPEFDELDERLAGLRPVQGVRDAAYLAWRYGAHTMYSHEVLCARRAGRLEGFAVLRALEGRALALVDLFAADEARARLAVEAVARAREAGYETVQSEVLAAGATAGMVGKLGFVRREQGVGPVPFFAPGSAHAKTLSEPANWWLIGGDRDI